MGSSPREATWAPPLQRGRLSVTSRRSSAMLLLTSSRRCPLLLPPPPSRSPTSSLTAKSSPSVMRGSGALRLFSCLPWNGGLWYPRDYLQLHHEVRCRHQEGPVRQHRHVRWHHHVPRYRRQDAEGDHRPCSLHHQDQDHRSPREEVLRLDRWLHLVFPLHLPADVDHQAGVRRVRPIHCPQEVLLNASTPLTC